MLTSLWNLFYISITYPFYYIRVLLKEIPHYRETPLLGRIDFYFFYHYFFFYPFIKNIYEKHKTGLDVSELVYGETPYASFQEALNYIPLSHTSVFYDLGCGKGRLVFFVSEKYGIPCVGVDIMPTYIRIAQNTAIRNRLEDIEFIEENIFDTAIETATVVYLAWTCFGRDQKEELEEKLETLQPDSYVITTSTPITSPQFELVKTLVVPFSWGKGSMYIQRKIHANLPTD